MGQSFDKYWKFVALTETKNRKKLLVSAPDISYVVNFRGEEIEIECIGDPVKNDDCYLFPYEDSNFLLCQRE